MDQDIEVVTATATAITNASFSAIIDSVSASAITAIIVGIVNLNFNYDFVALQQLAKMRMINFPLLCHYFVAPHGLEPKSPP